MSDKHVTTFGGIAQIMWQTLNSYSLNADAMFEQVGIRLPKNMASHERVEATAMQKLWRHAETESGDQAFGIQYARNTHPMALHGLGFSWLASDTLLEAFNRLVRYYRLISTAGEIILEESPDEYCLWYKIPAPKGVAAPASLDAAMALFIQLSRMIKGDGFSASRVELQRSPVTDPKPFEAFFRSDVTFDTDENRLFFDKESLNTLLPTANHALARANDQVVIDYLKTFDKEDIVSQIRANIIEKLPSGTLSQEKVADLMHMSMRSMQRKLSQHETSFKSIVEEVRKELAITYLRESNRSIGEITFLLGFTEPSNFSRSFKKWTGMTPNHFQTEKA